MNYNDQSAIVVGKGGTPLYYPAGKVQIGIRHVNRRAESMMTKAELFAQDIVLSPGFGKPRKPWIVKRLGDLSKRALDGFKFFAA